MFLAGLDCETWLIRQGAGVPPWVCFGWAISPKPGKVQTGLVTHRGEYTALPAGATNDPVDVVRALFQEVREHNGRFVNQSVSFDLACLCEAYPELFVDVFAMYEDGLVEDIRLRERLLDVARGSLGFWENKRNTTGKRVKKDYHLKDIVAARLGVELDKVTWRLGYRDLHDKPLSSWDLGAVQYAVDDVVCALDVYRHQRAEVLVDLGSGEVPNSVEQARAAWALDLMSYWGIRTERSAVAQLKDTLTGALAQLAAALRRVGFIRPNGTRDMKLIQGVLDDLRQSGVAVPVTESGERLVAAGCEVPAKYLSSSAEALESIMEQLGLAAPGDLDEALTLAQKLVQRERVGPQEHREGLAILSWYIATDKLLGTYLPPLELGTKYPINCRYETLVETGRTSCSNPNLQNLPKAPGVRECYVPRDGYLFATVDYEALELHTLAQACLVLLGRSALGEALNAGLDPHLMLAVDFLLEGNLSYSDAKKIRKDEKHPLHKAVVHARNVAKAANFGLPGGLGAKTFVAFCKSSGITITQDEAKKLKAAWLKQWPEMREYFAKISADLTTDDEGNDSAVVQQLYSARIRGKARYTAACNSYFQGLAADGAKEALFQLAKECYVPSGLLYGSRCVVFVHDEVIMEHPIALAHERAFIQAEIMVKAMEKFTPDVRIKAEPALMRRWYKSAAAKFDADQRLIPWEPEAGEA